MPRKGVAPVAIAVGLVAVISGWLSRPAEVEPDSAVPQPRPAIAGCGRAVVDDWAVDGRVDSVYAKKCYDDALAALVPSGPVDDTGWAVAAIERARAHAWGGGKPVPVPPP